MKPFLLFGKSGQVGSALQKSLARLSPIQAHDRVTCNYEKADDLRAAIRASNPSVIVNAAAYTAVDQAESDPAAMQVNAIAPGIMAEEAKRIGALLVHYSTDYVFDGRKNEPYCEDDPPNPLNVYGRSKLAGDLAVASAQGAHIILRVGWVYSATGRNFAKTILRLACERDRLTIVDDQFGAPTSADFIADMTASTVEAFLDGAKTTQSSPSFSGIYHLAPRGVASWHSFAVELVREARRQGFAIRVADDQILPIRSKEYPTPAQRPANSRLNTGKLQQLLGRSFSDWQDDVPGVVSALASAR
jgi:dTDP-4-dehydrorhamnose reductase